MKTLLFKTILNIFCSVLVISSLSQVYAMEEIAGKAIEGLSAANPYVSVALQAYYLCQEIRKHNFPTIEEKTHADEVAEQYTLITAQNEFQRCMIQNRNSAQRTQSGRPEICEEVARMLILLDDRNEVDRLTAIYNHYKNNH